MSYVVSERDEQILCEVVELYLATGEPVPSVALARASRTGLSSASLRNVMAELEEQGYLIQPHTSAGRIPSDLGFRRYLDRLQQHATLRPRDARRLRAILAPPGPLEEALAQVSRVLADMTTEVGMAVAPSSEHATLQAVHFVRVSAQRVLAVVVTAGGLVESRLLAVDRDFAAAELERISNYCRQTFAGLSVQIIRGRLLALMAEERAKADELLSGVVALATRAMEPRPGSGGEVFVEGTDRLLERASRGQLEVARRLLAALADKAALLSLLNDYLAGTGPRAVLGSEFSLAGNDDLGLIVTSFERASGERGLVGVIGLKCMDYPRIIPIVDHLGHYLGDPSGKPGGAE
ncbi:MAG: heat-inducible transcriptional repressor HrcA [Thermoanaerobaculales bacterium]